LLAHPDGLHQTLWVGQEGARKDKKGKEGKKRKEGRGGMA